MKFLSLPLALLSMLAAAKADAGSFNIMGLADGHLMVEAADASVAEILSSLARKRGFNVDGDATRHVSGKFSGPLDDVLRRILRSENFTVVYDAGGISRIVLLGGGTAGRARNAGGGGLSANHGTRMPEAATAPVRQRESIRESRKTAQSAESTRAPQGSSQGDEGTVGRPSDAAASMGGSVPSTSPVVFDAATPLAVTQLPAVIQLPSPGVATGIAVPSTVVAQQAGIDLPR